MAHDGRCSHLASSLSCIDILTALYWGVLRHDPHRPLALDRDRFILSKGHGASALYATLALRGYFPEKLLDDFAQDGSALAEHPPAGLLAGVEAATGSLGHGLPIGTGIAMAGRQVRLDYRTFVLMSDGETNEGSVWEAAALASEQRLNRLCVIVDANGWQGIDRARDSVDTLIAKFKAFGWWTVAINGHSPLMCSMIDLAGSYSQPTAFVAETVKGKGITFMEDDQLWHYRSPNTDETARALAELASA